MRAIRRMRGDEDGTILVFVAIALAVLLGMVALSFDLGRMASTQSELQSFADSVALAAAGELDGRSNSITRATTAANALIQDRQSFGQGGQDLTSADFTLTFLRSLPTSDTAAATDVTTDPRKAAFVRVDVVPHTVTINFASALSVLIGGTDRTSQVAATATAGFTQYACDITPLMFCLPTEGVEVGQMVNLVSGGGSGKWGAGNFGFLDIEHFVDPGGPCGDVKGAANITRCILGAQESTTQCYSMRGVDTKTGERVGITTDPFNYRFDMYPTSMKTEDRDSFTFAPAPNTIRGFVPTVKNAGKKNESVDWCIPDTAAMPTSMGMPRDDSLVGGVRFGTDRSFSGAERTRYVNMNYAGVDPHPTVTTRWAFYRAEIDAHGGPGSRTAILDAISPYRETGRAQCSASQSSDYERRVVIAAGINCDPANGGTEIKGDSDNVPVEEFYNIFLTEPVGTTGSTLSIYGEIIGIAGGAGSTDDGTFHDVVQLYR